jgi:hypothetical protein
MQLKPGRPLISGVLREEGAITVDASGRLSGETAVALPLYPKALR